MATLRDIRRRIVSVRNTRQITSAMRMVSAAKLNRAQHNARRAQPYADRLRHVAVALCIGLTGEDHPFFRPGEGGKTLVVLYTSDRGLCGSFNSGINKTLERAIKSGEIANPELVAMGRVGNDYFRRRGVPIARAVLFVRDAEKAAQIADVTQEIGRRFEAGELARVLIAYNRYVNPIRQEPTLLPLLPIEPRPERRTMTRREILFEPDRDQILRVMLARYLQNQLFQAHLNTEAGEHGARMAAMEGATKNAGKMIDSLTLQYNRARQANITKELIEIVNGAQSL